MRSRAPWRACATGALCALPLLSHAQTSAESSLPTVNVVADKEAVAEDFSTTQTTRINGEQITEQQVKNIKDAVRYEPGVTVTNNPSRFGLAGFNIRGVEENRILLQVDGVRMPDNFVIGGYSNASRNMVDIELLNAIEIERGTGSAKHGSEALGGSVSYITPSPEDILKGERRAATIKGMYQSVDRSTVWVATGAAGGEGLKLLVRGVWRDGRESKTLGDVGGTGLNRTEANPQQHNSDAALVKLAITPSARYRAELGYQHSDRDVDTHVLSQAVGGLAKDMNADDRYRHQQWSLDQRFSQLPVGTVDLKLYEQKGLTTQYTRQDRVARTAFAPVLYERYFSFGQNTTGLKIEGQSQLKGWGEHLLNWGGDWSSTRTEQLRDGYTTLRNGTVSREVTVDTFPTRDTPPADTRRWALYAQDDWVLSDQLTVVAGGRYENYRLTPHPDAIYLANEAAAPATGARFKNFAPKLGAIWGMGAGYTLAAQYARGFRPPPYNDVNIGFANLQASYTAIANPDLQPETSRGIELALRHVGAAGRWSITAFDTRYRNFIETVQLDCPADPACSSLVNLTFQASNAPAVRIYGLEGKLQQEFAPGWTLLGSLAYAVGRRTLTDEPLDSVNPMSGTLGLIHTRGPFRYEVSTTFAARKRDSDAVHYDSGELARQFLTSGYAVVDLRFSWAFAKNSLLTFGVSNLFDRLYYQWADIPVSDIHIADTQAGPERYSSPGRNFAVSLVYAF